MKSQTGRSVARRFLRLVHTRLRRFSILDRVSDVAVALLFTDHGVSGPSQYIVCRVTHVTGLGLYPIGLRVRLEPCLKIAYRLGFRLNDGPALVLGGNHFPKLRNLV